MAKLSILIPTLNSREALLQRLMDMLAPQLTDEVEVLTAPDNGELSIGEKRNHLIQQATGDYVCFIDDDDRISEDYISQMLAGISQGVDAVCIQGINTEDGQDESLFFDVPYQEWKPVRRDGKRAFARGIQHLDAIRREIASAVKFPHLYFSEDHAWGKALESKKLIKSWHCLDHPIYFYDHINTKPSPLDCDVAIIMPCYNHVEVTRQSVESLLENTLSSDYCLIMVDDASTDSTWEYAGELRDRLGMHRFYYHRSPQNRGVNPSWNIGLDVARTRHAKSAIIVNNDVLFSPGWDTALLSSLDDPNVGVVSPLSTFGELPSDWPEGKDRNVNPAGYVGYMPILGACFAARMETFNEVGPFPEDLKIYFGDNWLVLAAQSRGFECGYETKSYVHHLFCITTSKLDNEPIWSRERPIFEGFAARYAKFKPFIDEPNMKAYGDRLQTALLGEQVWE